MKLFVTGGAGYIGSICVEELLNAGHEVTILDNFSEGHRQALDPRARMIEADLAVRQQVLKALKESEAEAVLHFAAHALVGESMTNPSKYFRNNVGSGVNLLDAMAAAGVKRIIFSSTCAIYGQPEKMPMTEDTPQNPTNPYGESKRMFEQMLKWYDTVHGIKHIALRYFNAAGASARFGEHHHIETHLIPNVLAVALGRKPHVEIYGTDYPTPDGTCIRDYIHIVDLAQAHMLALKRLSEAGQSDCYNLGNGDGYSVREVIEVARSVTGHAIPAIERPRRPGDPPRLIASAAKAIQHLGWQPRYPKLRQIVESAWQWHNKNPKGYAA
jgi:UDP-glucose 4-epimerase